MIRHPYNPILRAPMKVVATALAVSVFALLAGGSDADRDAPMTAAPIVATSLTVPAAADTYVDSSAKRSNYGSAKQLAAGTSPNRRTYIRFDVPDPGQPIGRAWLRVRASAASATGFEVRVSDSANWDENKVTWSSAPKLGQLVATSGGFVSGEWIIIDVTAWVRPGRALTIALVAATAIATFASRESADSPSLELELPAPPTPTSAPTTATTVATTTSTAPSTTAAPTTTTTAPAATAGAAYYVDPVAGSDANAGTSPSTPWRTLSRATSQVLAAGEQLLLRRGGSWTGSLTVAESGTSTAPITVGAYGDGAAPIITGASTCLTLSGSFITVSGLQVDGCTWAGISISGARNVVTGNVATHNSVGITVRPGGTDNRVVNNTVVDNQRMSVLTVGGSDDSGAFGITLEGDRTEVAYNQISGHVAQSYDFGADGAAVEVYGGRDNDIHHNIATENNAFTELGNSRSSGNRYRYNLVTSSLPDATFLITRGAGSSFGPVASTTASNNTVVLTGSGASGFVCHAGCNTGILTLRNNIIQATWKAGYADGPIDGDHNVYWVGIRQFTLGANDLVVDPGFVSATDLHLAAGSPAVDTGAPLGETTDLDGAALVGAPDRGAFERR